MNLSISKFQDLTLYSNKNIEKLASSVVSQSSNAVLTAMYEDGAILLDHKTGQFYMCEYAFDPKEATILFENFDPITLVRDNDNFRDTVYNFFDTDNVTTADLAEDFKDIVLEQDKFLDELVAESMMYKNFDGIVDYEEVAQNNKDHGLQNESFFLKYQERLATHPLTEAKYFNWTDPVQVSLVETEKYKLLNSSAKEKAHSLWKHALFKEGFAAAAQEFIDDVDQGIDSFVNLFEEFPQIFYLDSADRKTMFGKIIIGDPSIRESRVDLLTGLDLIFEREESIIELSQQYLSESGYTDEYAPGVTRYAAETFAKGESTDFTDDNGKVGPSRAEKDEMFVGGKRTGADAKDKDDDKPEELTSDELEKLADAICKVAEKLKGAAKDKLEKIAEKLEKGKEEGTSISTVKEAVELLSL